MSTILCVITVVLAFFLFRLLFECFQIHSGKVSKTKLKNDTKTATIITLGSGGHTSEMLRLVHSLGPKFAPKVYIVGKSDEMSKEKIRTMNSTEKTSSQLICIPRSRNVHQSYLTSVFTTIYSCLYCLGVVIKILPDLVGYMQWSWNVHSYMSSSIFIKSDFWNTFKKNYFLSRTAYSSLVLSIKKCRIIFVESICRVETISLSGKILYFFADEFLVQWPNLIKSYPRAKYLGRL
uniref:UDP-N-acetylglucosamine transferase subunit ALG14 n=1 Tax=Strigamia maritima TaxID=126957 RepID=T1JLJ3_STRMM